MAISLDPSSRLPPSDWNLLQRAKRQHRVDRRHLQHRLELSRPLS